MFVLFKPFNATVFWTRGHVQPALNVKMPSDVGILTLHVQNIISQIIILK